MKVDLLIKQVADGNRVAFEKLYNGCYRLVYAVAYSVTGNSMDTEDVVADVFVTVWKKANSYQGGSGKAWLCSIAKNHALNFIKKRDRENAELIETKDYGSYSIEQGVEKKIAVERALNVLSEEERETVLLHNAGLKHREIASLMDTAIGTVTWRYNTALKKMREFLTGDDYEK
jgi:RNA polymerase sigma-70 factor (ECF subfamily)